MIDSMDMMPAALAAQQAITQQNVALSMIKKSAEMQQQIADVILEGAQSVSASSRGGIVNIAA
ncbi:MAG: hypothetical protein DI626_08855 [Micavibrio aeruginosavorus]|uniref:Motility protein n=1 Tax=Micavibrio aeruginosavorus TaxID=349221 RepID=A0A2W4ZMQ8_9BACT|nr:MAG: hypothetical protein DI626_08855 [Micavibrio aeruginosavorus]